MAYVCVYRDKMAEFNSFLLCKQLGFQDPQLYSDIYEAGGTVFY